MCIDDKFSQHFDSHLDADGVYNSINGINTKSKYRSDVIKEHFNKALEMTKKGDDDFYNSSKG